MHNLIALSLELPGTPLHGLNDFEPRSRSASAPLRPAPGSLGGPPARAEQRHPQPTPGRRVALRARRPAPN